MPPPLGQMFYMGLYRENLKKKTSCLKPEGLDFW